MAIYKIEDNNKKLVKIDTTSLGEEVVWESALRRMLRDRPEVLEDGLLIIAEEFGNWQDVKRRIDLLGLDDAGRLVVIELKRGYTGEQMDLQAIRYAAMVANMSLDDVAEAHQKYLKDRATKEPDRGPVEENDARNTLREQYGGTDGNDPVIHTEIPRIILVSEDFGKELTTCVLWLNDSWLREGGQEIKCVRLQPHRNYKEILIEANVVIPLPEASEYQMQRKRLEQGIRSAGSTETLTRQGADAFQESIESVSETFRPGLALLYQAAKAMETNKTAELSTTVKGKNFTINLMVPGRDNALVTFTNILEYKGKEYGGEIAFLPELANAAPKSRPHIEQLIGADVLKNRYRRLTVKKHDWDAILAAIGEAYREATGILPT
ncbi:MAG: endonuclease NucS [Chloroflexi bacterium]|nr:endonuclease NucS [Chloroflexota bacterium]